MPPARELRIRHLLLVAGPSGAGKSVFLQQLAAGDLTEEVRAALPPGASAWPQSNGARLLSGAIGRHAEGGRRIVDGLVLHYDFMRTFETRIDDFREDPALAALASADLVTAVMIRPDADRLVRQLGRRRSRSGWLPDLLKQMRRRIMRSLRRTRRVIYHSAPPGERHARLAALYAAPGFLDARYAGWEAFLRREAGPRLSAPILWVAPGAGPGEASFAVLRVDTDG